MKKLLVSYDFEVVFPVGCIGEVVSLDVCQTAVHQAKNNSAARYAGHALYFATFQYLEDRLGQVAKGFNTNHLVMSKREKSGEP